jgi:hypothetical protein
MDLIIGFVVLCIVVFLLFLTCAGVYGFWALITGNKGHEKRKARHLDELRNGPFSGEKETVPYRWSNMQPASRADVVELADSQGYRLVSSSDDKHASAMYFEKR